MTSWKLTTFAKKPVIEAALAQHEAAADWDADIGVTGFEIADDKPDDWRLDAYIPRRPTEADKAAIAALFKGKPPAFEIEKLPDEDWLTVSQQGVQPIREGRFHIHTPDHPAIEDAGVIDFVIPAAQAFGTGQHETTAGCLAMLDAMHGKGVQARRIIDVGTGTGLLAFAGRALWPRAEFTASDIDPLCIEAVETNADTNAVPLGAARGAVLPVLADGLDEPVLDARAPYDLIIANILAAPLIEMAPDFARASSPRASLVLAGLLETQEAAVRRAYRLCGFRLAQRLVRGDWSILWLRKRTHY